jgi:serine/threonine protein kinase
MEERVERRLGNYRLTRLLARGGFAEVYLGQHIYLNSQAAIKVLLTRLSNDDKASFLNEARTLVNLIHPNIVRVLEFGIEDQTPFLVMDYAPNGSLRQCHPKGTRLPLSSVINYVKQAADALQYAHDQRLIHRDIKPENMLLGRNNELLISDFGIAVFAHSSLSASTQQIIGTVAYMAPEQVQGKPRLASDQYSLAIVAYEWLCGERPFHGSLSEIATQQMFGDPPALREKAPDIPPDVEQVIMTALAKDYTQRYNSILDFATALECAGQSLLQPTQAVQYLQDATRSHVLVVKSSDSATPVSPASPTNRAQASMEIRSAFSGERKETRYLPFLKIERRKLRNVALTVLLYSISSNFVVLIHLPPVQSLNLLWMLPALVIPIISGIIYGFWAGLITGGLGYLLGNYITIALRWNTTPNSPVSFLTLSSLSLPWYFNVAFLAIGSIAGLATIFTKGRYDSARNVLIAEMFSILSILCAFFIAFNGLWPRLYSYESVWLDFTHIALPNMVLVAVLLSVLLIIYRFTIGIAGHLRHGT